MLLSDQMKEQVLSNLERSQTMFKLTLRYIRYAFSMLASLGFQGGVN